MDLKIVKALFLDLDGTVRRTKSGEIFPKQFDDMELMPGIEKIIMLYRRMGWFIAGISNQGGVAHGFKSVQDVEAEMHYMMGLFASNPFDAIKQCYHDAGGTVEPYNHRSLFRKPGTGMLVLLEMECFQRGLIIDWENSLFVGDRPEDEGCAKNANIKFHHIDDFLTMPQEFDI